MPEGAVIGAVIEGVIGEAIGGGCLSSAVLGALVQLCGCFVCGPLCLFNEDGYWLSVFGTKAHLTSAPARQ